MISTLLCRDSSTYYSHGTTSPALTIISKMDCWNNHCLEWCLLPIHQERCPYCSLAATTAFVTHSASFRDSQYYYNGQLASSISSFYPTDGLGAVAISNSPCNYGQPYNTTTTANVYRHKTFVILVMRNEQIHVHVSPEIITYDDV